MISAGRLTSAIYLTILETRRIILRSACLKNIYPPSSHLLTVCPLKRSECDHRQIITITIDSETWNYSQGSNTGAGPKNISRHSRHKRNTFPVSATVRGFATGKCGLLPQHFRHGIVVAVVTVQYRIGSHGVI